MKLQRISDMPRITRSLFCENMDDVLAKVNLDNTGIVIYEENKDDLLLCPASWFNITWKDNIYIPQELKEDSEYE